MLLATEGLYSKDLKKLYNRPIDTTTSHIKEKRCNNPFVWEYNQTNNKGFIIKMKRSEELPRIINNTCTQGKLRRQLKGTGQMIVGPTLTMLNPKASYVCSFHVEPPYLDLHG